MKSLLIALLTLWMSGVHAQGFRVRHVLPGVSTAYSKAIFETSPGNYITGGIVIDSATGASQLCIMGLNSTGQKLWVKKYGRTKFQYLHNPFISRSFYKQGNFMYHAGISLDSNNKYVGVFIKFNFNGDTIWQRRFYEPSDYIYPQMVTGSIDGGFLITGMFEDPVNIGRNVMLIKTNASGQELWRKKIGKAYPNVGAGVAIIQDTATQKIVIAGYQYISGSVDYDNIVITNSQGTKLSQHNYLTTPGGSIFDLIQTKDKKFVAAGFAQSAQTIGGYNLQQSYIVKFDLNNPATPLWTIKNHGKLSLTNTFFCLKELQDSTLLIGGFMDSLRGTGAMYINTIIKLAKVTSGGAITWNHFYSYKSPANVGDNYQKITSLDLCTDGSWLASIECSSPGIRNPLFFVKLDSTGCDSTGDYCKRFMSTVGISKNKLAATSVEVFPNPFNSVLTVNVADFNNEPAQLLITDLSGRVLKEQQIAMQQQDIDLRELSNGIYILTLSRDKEIAYKGKIIKD